MNLPRRIAFGILLAVLVSLGASLSRSIPPAEHTNAPGESNCTACHNGTLNSGPGSLSLSGITTYVPGNIYTLTFNVSDNTKSRFGFSLTSLNSSNQATGTLAVLNATNTSLTTGVVSGGTRQYINHNNASSNQSWSFRWTAPSTNVGPITFYAAGNATNANGNTTGDNVYAQSFVINPAPTPPSAGFTASASSICLNQSLTFTNTSTGSINGYAWDFGAGASPATASTAGPHNVSYSTAGPKTVRLIVTGPGGSDTTEQGITVNALPMVSLTGLAPSYCSNEGDVLLSGSPTGGVFSGPGVTGGMFSPASAGAGQQVVSYVFTDLNGCAASAFDTTTVLAAPAVTVSPSGPYNLCPGDSITLDAGAGYSSYAWSDGSSSQTTTLGTAGIYEVIVSAANGCRDTSGLIVVNSFPNPVVNITINGDSLFCDGDSAVLDAGSSFAGYLWNTGATGQTLTVTNSGMYNVTVTDTNGCSDTAAVPVQISVIPSPPVPGILPQGDSISICEGDTLLLVADSGYVTYQWSTGEFGQTLQTTVPGAFYVVVSDSSGCSTFSGIKEVIVNPLPVPVISIAGQDTLTTGIYVSYEWAFFDTLTGAVSPISGANSRTFPSGDYRNDPGFTGAVVVTVIDENGCQNTSDPFPVPAATSLDKNFSLIFEVYPNPVNDQLWIYLHDNVSRDIQVSLLDLQGKVLLRNAFRTTKFSLSTASLPAGVYLLEVRNGQGRNYQKIVKR